MNITLSRTVEGVGEIYPAIQGEGPSMGEHVVFVRLAYCNLTCNFCLVGGTNILMADGSQKPIEKIEKGDKVKSYNPETGELEDDVVARTMRRMTSLHDRILEIKLEEGTWLRVTTNHEIMTERGWVMAGDLLETDVIIMVDAE